MIDWRPLAWIRGEIHTVVFWVSTIKHFHAFSRKLATDMDEKQSEVDKFRHFLKDGMILIESYLLSVLRI